MNNFRRYDKIYRLGTKETVGILKGIVYVSPKLDGTNASIWYDDGLVFGSRSRRLGQGDDNAGFKAAHEGDPRLLDLFKEHPNWRLYGEFLVPHTIKGYRDDAWRKLYLYDVHDGERFLLPHEWELAATSRELQVIPHYALGNPTESDIAYALEQLSDFLMREGKRGEGIVLKNFDFVNHFGSMVYAKVINEVMHEAKLKVDRNTEDQIALACVNPELVKKIVAKILVAEGAEYFDNKMIPRFIETLYHDVITEKLYGILCSMKHPPVNFRQLKSALANVARQTGEVSF